MTDRGKKITVIILGPLVGIVIYLSFKLRNDERDQILQNGIEVIGTISSVGWKTIDISYTVDGEIYSYTQNKPYSDLASGEQFYTLASKKDLNRAVVYYTKPILDTIKYKFAVVNPLDVDKLIIDGSELSFTYKVGTTEYDRIQKYEEGKRPNDIENLKVKYRIDRPEIGYLVEIK